MAESFSCYIEKGVSVSLDFKTTNVKVNFGMTSDEKTKEELIKEVQLTVRSLLKEELAHSGDNLPAIIQFCINAIRRPFVAKPKVENKVETKTA
jgi:hypothetical protein